jgi:hypothetical protein
MAKLIALVTAESQLMDGWLNRILIKYTWPVGYTQCLEHNYDGVSEICGYIN